VDGLTVQRRAQAVGGAEHLVEQRDIGCSYDRLPFGDEGYGRAEVREAVNVVEGAVQGVDEPAVVTENSRDVLGRRAVLFADDRLTREGGLNHGLGGDLRLEVCDGHKVAPVAVLRVKRDGGLAVLEVDHRGRATGIFGDQASLFELLVGRRGQTLVLFGRSRSPLAPSLAPVPPARLHEAARVRE